MSRTANPYPAGRMVFTAWAKGYRGHRNGQSRPSVVNEYVMPSLRRAWLEGWDAARADVAAENQRRGLLP